MSNLIEVDVLGDRNANELKSQPYASRGREVIETDFVEFPDGALAEVVEDPTDPNCTSLGIWRHGKIQYFKKLEHEGRVFVPLQRTNEVLRQIRLPNAARPFESLEALICSVQKLIYRCVDIEDFYIPVLASFVLATWIIDRLLVAPYLAVVGLSQSGKTTLLRVLNLVCRRALLISDITSMDFYRLSTLTPTLLIDEAATIANGHRLRHILRAGATRNVLAVRENHVFDSYGAKIFSWPELPDDPALTSRCILIPMSESARTDLTDPTDPEVERLGETLRAKLFQFRLQNYASIKSAPINGDEILRPRTRDLLRALSAATLQDHKRSQSLFNFFRNCYAVPLESMRVEQNAVLWMLFKHVHAHGDPNSILVGDLAKKVNHWLKSSGERLRLKDRKVGAVLTSLGLTNRSRGNSGYYIHFAFRDLKRIHDLLKTYGIDQLSEHLVEYYAEQGCRLCRPAVS